MFPAHRLLRAWLSCCLLMTIFANEVAGMDSATPVAGGDKTVVTDAGPVRGTNEDGYRLFQGIPFATPPVGDLRWESPQPVEPWTEARDATSPGNWCVQPEDAPGGLGGGSEDCLYLNVTAPVTATAEHPLPVMVWIHGGGFVSGAGSIFDARRLAVQGDVVVVTVNYRLGIFGFFGLEGLPNSGAFGLEDQIAALQWVQRNAAAFGGDPDNVTLFGESAGGMSTCALLASPMAEDLFHRAIVQSGACTIDWPNDGIFAGAEAGSLWGSIATLNELGNAVAASVGCDAASDRLACLRQTAADDLMAIPLVMAYGRVSYGNDVLPENPAEVMRAAGALPVPVMMGITRDEGRTFVSFDPEPITDARFAALLGKAFGDGASAVEQAYPLSVHASPGLAWAAAMTDRVWACPTLENLELLATETTVYAYEFADRDAPSLFPFPPDLPGGAYHGSEILSLFDLPIPGFDPGMTADQLELADVMIAYWANFAHQGDPNGDGLPAWEPFTTNDSPPFVQSLAPGADGVHPIDFAARHQCAFWATVEDALPAS